MLQLNAGAEIILTEKPQTQRSRSIFGGMPLVLQQEARGEESPLGLSSESSLFFSD